MFQVFDEWPEYMRNNNSFAASVVLLISRQHKYWASSIWADKKPGKICLFFLVLVVEMTGIGKLGSVT